MFTFHFPTYVAEKNEYVGKVIENKADVTKKWIWGMLFSMVASKGHILGQLKAKFLHYKNLALSTEFLL